MDVQCPVCEQVILLRDRYCDQCGANQAHVRRVCRRCGYQGRARARFCAMCGESVQNFFAGDCVRCSAICDESDRFCRVCGSSRMFSNSNQQDESLTRISHELDAKGANPRESSASADLVSPQPDAAMFRGTENPSPLNLPTPRPSLPQTRGKSGLKFADLRQGSPKDARDNRSSPDTQEEQRKLATVLFADVSGFTAMSELLDPEQVRDIMDRCFEALTTEIENQGGTIDKYIGDCVMAYFGIPKAHEDDPQRAVRAGIRMLDALATFSDELERSTGLRLGMRVGINTGKVLAGRVGGHDHKDFTVYGDAVNVASRLEHAAPVGSVLISEDTYKAVRAWFVVKPQAPLSVKGKSEPLRTFCVLSEIAEPGSLGMRGIEGLRVDMVGRDAELSALLVWADEMRRNNRGRIVTILGPAGIGKSRLVEELSARLTDIRLIVKARCLPPGFGKPFHVVRELSAGLLGLASGQPSEENLTKAGVSHDGAAALARLWQGAVPVSADETELLARRTYRGLQELVLSSLSKQTAGLSTVLILEDVHWADPAMLDLVDFLGASANAALLILCISRQELLDVRPAFSEGKDHHRRLDLQPLSDVSTAALVRALLANVDVVPEAVVNQITSRAAGNPFFVEEWIRVLLDSGVIKPSGKRWTLSVAALSRLELPGSIQAVLQARLDSLPDQERDTIVTAAVIGRVFWQEAVDMLVGIQTEPLLSRLRGRGLLFGRDGTTVRGQHEFVFASAMLQAVAYDRVLLRTKRELHKHIAQWLKDHVDWSNADTTLLGTYAGHLAVAELYDDAWTAWCGAAERSRVQGDDGQAYAYLNNAIELTSKGKFIPPDYVDVLIRYGDVCDRLARYADGRTALQKALQQLTQSNRRLRGLRGLLVRQTGLGGGKGFCPNSVTQSIKLPYEVLRRPFRRLAQTRLGLGNIGVRTGDLVVAADMVTAAQRVAEADQLPECWELAARVAFYRGQYDLAESHCRRVLTASATPRQRIAALRTLSMVGLRLGKLDMAEDAIEQGQQLCREVGDELLACRMKLMRANLDNLYGNSTAAIDGYLDACQVAEKLSDFHTARMCHNNLGELYVEQSRWSDAQKPLEKSALLCTMLGVTNQVSDTLRLLGEVMLRLGDLGQAEELGLRALQSARQTGERNFEAEAARFLAQIYLQDSGSVALERADRQFVVAVSILQEIRSEVLLAKSWLRFAESLIESGKRFDDAARVQMGITVAQNAADAFAKLGMVADRDKAWELSRFSNATVSSNTFNTDFTETQSCE
ncbi:MAG: AAA family ATPase [Myxococcales bacterium]|nr:AAA family ATPase [Myxococcales bacterium]